MLALRSILASVYSTQTSGGLQLPGAPHGTDPPTLQYRHCDIVLSYLHSRCASARSRRALCQSLHRLALCQDCALCGLAAGHAIECQFHCTRAVVENVPCVRRCCSQQLRVVANPPMHVDPCRAQPTQLVFSRAFHHATWELTVPAPLDKGRHWACFAEWLTS